MVRCWYIREHSFEERSAENFEHENATLSIEEMHAATGALHWKLDADTYESDGSLAKIRSERGYTYQDEIAIDEKSMGAAFVDKQRAFFTEHFHSHEEIRFIMDGEGYFDLRDFRTGKWVRILVERGDLLVVPAGEYHRFALTDKQHVRVLRLFIGEPVWVAINRDTQTDEHPSRVTYSKTMETKAATVQ